MEIKIDDTLIKRIMISESQKLVGKSMKRFEMSEDKEEIKKHIKELIYEGFRDIADTIIYCSSKEAIHLTKK